MGSVRLMVRPGRSAGGIFIGLLDFWVFFVRKYDPTTVYISPEYRIRVNFGGSFIWRLYQRRLLADIIIGSGALLRTLLLFG